jgi:hypothetical protein
MVVIGPRRVGWLSASWEGALLRLAVGYFRWSQAQRGLTQRFVLLQHF